MNPFSFFFKYTGTILLLLTFVGNPNAVAQYPTVADSPSVCVLDQPLNFRLQPYIYVLTDTSTGYTLGEILQPRLQSLFTPYAERRSGLRSHQAYWGKIQLENRLPDAEKRREWVLNLTETFTRVTLYTLSENGAWAGENNGSFVPAQGKSFVPTRAGNWFKLSLPPKTVVTLYFKAECEHTALLPSFQAYVQPADSFYSKLLNAKIWSTLFTGFLLMMLFYNLLNYFFVRDSSYVYYTGYLSMVLLYTAYASDDIEDWLGSFMFVEHPVYFRLFKIAIFAGLMSYLAFIRSFLDLEHLLPKWDRYFRYLTWAGIPLAAVYLWLAFHYQFSYSMDDQPILSYIGLVSLSCFVFVYPLSKTRDAKGFFITAGIAVISVGFLLTLHSRMTETPFTVFYLKAGTILELLIFSMGLAYRQRQHELAKQQADFALRESHLLQEKKQLEADRLQELNAFKSRFYTNITHEFRTPLTVILGMAERLSADAGRLKPEDARGKLGLIQRNGENLMRLVNEMLDLAKLESNTLKINYIQGDVLTFIKYITESMHSLANAQNLLLRVESRQTSILMDYDPERLLQIVHNLLSNAIKFTPSGGRIEVRVEEKEKWLSIAVKDSGVGISAEELPYLFERFYQAKNQIAPQDPLKGGTGSAGSGIGLSLTRELVGAMGGAISVDSAPGAGSTFLVKLPITNNGVLDAKTPEIAHTSSESRLPEAEQDTGRQTILLIEDNPDVVEYLLACLKEAHQLDFAYNGQAGIEKALETVPDLIVSDVMMPFKDGFEVVDALKNDERTSHIPIVLLTAKADVQSRLAGLRKGADAYLSKPFHQEELLVTIDNLLETRRILQSKYQQQLSTELYEEAEVAEIDDVFLQKVRAIIAAQYSDDGFGLPQLCQKIGMSRSQLFRKLKALTDIGPSDLIRTHRLHKAKELLESGAANVTEATWQVGFKDPSYFSKLYQEEFGMAPSATRK